MSFKVTFNDSSSFKTKLGTNKNFSPDFHSGTGGSSTYKAYEGSYDITPDVEAQTMNTANKLMTDNVTIRQIPTYEVSNSTGKTFIIGREV